MKFGEALEQLKNHLVVRRKGWHGQSIHMVIGSDNTRTGDGVLVEGVRGDLFEFVPDAPRRLPHLALTTGTGLIATGWSPTQNDLLAEDWELC